MDNQITTLEKEVAAIVARQTVKETTGDRSITSLLEGYSGEEKALKRGQVGCDGVG